MMMEVGRWRRAAQPGQDRTQLLAQHGADVDILDSKLSTLYSTRSVRRRWEKRAAAAGRLGTEEELTARTLSSDVLPAFCNPIMVMSISVALDGTSSQS